MEERAALSITRRRCDGDGVPTGPAHVVIWLALIRSRSRARANRHSHDPRTFLAQENSHGTVHSLFLCGGHRRRRHPGGSGSAESRGAPIRHDRYHIPEPPLLRSWDATVDSLRRSGELTLIRTRADTVLRGRTHQRYQQYVNGIRVVGGEITRQTSGGLTTSIFGALHEVTGLPDSPAVSEDRAREILRPMAVRDVPSNRPLELVVFPLDDGTFALAYSTHIWTRDGWMQIYLDAQDGRVLQQYNDLHTQAAVGKGTGVLGDTKKVSAQAPRRDGTSPTMPCGLRCW